MPKYRTVTKWAFRLALIGIVLQPAVPCLAAVNSPAPLGGWVVVAPPIDGLSPILLPPGIIPPGTTQISLAIPGQLPAGLPPVSGEAEQTALLVALTFELRHPNAQMQVTDRIIQDVFTVVLVARDGNAIFLEEIREDLNGIQVSMVEYDGAHVEALQSMQLARPAAAELRYLSQDGGNVTSFREVAELNGRIAIRQWP